MSQTESHRSTPPIWLSLLRLMRVGNWPTAISNILAATLVARGGWVPVEVVCLLMVASLCLFAGGMVLNDWNDVEVDAVERPDRPIPSGQVTRRSAIFLTIGLFVAAIIISMFVDRQLSDPERFGWLTTATSLTLVVLIVLYDVLLKRTLLAPSLMGLCRGGNFLLGASAVAGGPSFLLGFQQSAIALAVLLTIYVTGVTWVARNEAGKVVGGTAVLGFMLIAAALIGYALFPKAIIDPDAAMFNPLAFQALIVWITLSFLLKMTARMSASSGNDQLRPIVITALKNMILVDASIALLFGSGSIVFALIVVCLYPVATILGRMRPLT